MDALLDRDGELEALGAGTERAREGEGSVVLLEAPAGGGKIGRASCRERE